MSIKIAIVVSRFNSVITHALKQSCIQKLEELDVKKDAIKVVEVPGAVEIPLVAKFLAKSGKYDAVITLGPVIYGETDHYDYVCQFVTHGCMQAMLETEMPIIFGILTTRDYALAKARVDGTHSNTGAECAQAAVDMVHAVRLAVESK